MAPVVRLCLFEDGTFQKVIDARAEQHFNYIHGVVHDSGRAKANELYSVKRPDGKDDCDTLNPPYFQQLDRRSRI